MNIRQLKQGDEHITEGFLKLYAETSMFMRGNLHHAGLGYDAQRMQGQYWGAFDDHALQGVLAHYWNGNIMVQVPDDKILGSLLAAFKDVSTRDIKGVLGAVDQAEFVINWLDVASDAWAINRDEVLYALDLKDMQIDERARACQLVHPRDVNADIMVDWLREYGREALGAENGADQDQCLADEVKHMQEGDYRWVLMAGGIPVSLCGFNAQLPDMVQIGPVWTPPEQRSRGYARSVLALALEQARARGVKHSILFTDTPAAAKAYEAIGYKQCGHFRIALLKEAVRIEA